MTITISNTHFDASPENLRRLSAVAAETAGYTNTMRAAKRLLMHSIDREVWCQFICATPELDARPRPAKDTPSDQAFYEEKLAHFDYEVREYYALLRFVEGVGIDDGAAVTR